MPPVSTEELRGEEQGKVPPTELPRNISEIQFDTFSPEEIRKLSNVFVFEHMDHVPGKQLPFGVLDPRLGVCDRHATCRTCGLKVEECAGHFGHMELSLPVFHNGFLGAVLLIMRSICKGCARVMLVGEARDKLLAKMRSNKLSSARRQNIQANLGAAMQKVVECPHCGFINGRIRREKGHKVPRLFHDKYGSDKKPKALHQEEKVKLDHDLSDAINSNNEIAQHLSQRAYDALTPQVVRALLDRIPPEDRELLDLDRNSSPAKFVPSTLLVPPVCIRPYVDGSGAGGAVGTFKDDDLTMNLYQTLYTSENLCRQLGKGELTTKVYDSWESLQCEYGSLIDSDLPGFPAGGARNRRGLVQRLKGKEGRFRKHLSGKRVDFSGRTVISPDPSLRITELAVPVLVAQVLTYPEKVNEHNRLRLFQAVCNGAKTHPGAVYVKKKSGLRRSLAVLNERERRRIAEELMQGDTVERHMINGDCVIFNRQPSLHRISMMCHRARILPYRTFRFNVCVCAPYNADFDGDEMNIHLPQTEEARAECAILMSTSRNMVSARHGEPMIAATQDFLTGGYLITRKDTFLDRAEASRALADMYDPDVVYELPPPCILKPRELWSGKQIVSLMIRPNTRVRVQLNFEAKTKNYTSDEHMCRKDGWVCFHNSLLVSGCMDKKIMGGGGKDGLFYQLFLANGHAYSAKVMWRLSRLTAKWLMNKGFSIGINDVTPSSRLVRLTNETIAKGRSDCAVLIKKYNTGTLEADPGCTTELTVESRLNALLSGVRSDCGAICMKGVLHWSNSPFIMSSSGSKGSPLNIGQMAAVLGQQTVSGKRIGNGFIHRSLPHFKRFSREPEDRGFVANSFYTGLQPSEFWFHTMGGREGLVDTAVKTAETGYMQRRLVKSMEDLCVQYDNTVMDSQGTLIQRVYGDDGIDPLYTETADFRPVNFDILWVNLSVSRHDTTHKEKHLLPHEIAPLVDKILKNPTYTRTFSGKFMKELRAFWDTKAKQLHVINKTLKLDEREECVDAVTRDPSLSPLEAMKLEATRRDKARMSRQRVQSLANDMLLVTDGLVDVMIEECYVKHLKYTCEPGTACGAVGAQSIGEPGTQMTLKTFHFAGVAAMSITQGVPRIAEIINAAKNIKTPLIRARLLNSTSERSAKIVKARVERTTLSEICTHVDECYSGGQCYLVIRVDLELIFNMQLDINTFTIRESILAYAHSTSRKRLRSLLLKENHIPIDQVTSNTITIYPNETHRDKLMHCISSIRTHLPDIVVAGIQTVKRAIVSVSHEETVYDDQVQPSGEVLKVPRQLKHYHLLIEGSDLLRVWLSLHFLHSLCSPRPNLHLTHTGRRHPGY